MSFKNIFDNIFSEETSEKRNFFEQTKFITTVESVSEIKRKYERFNLEELEKKKKKYL